MHTVSLGLSTLRCRLSRSERRDKRETDPRGKAPKRCSTFSAVNKSSQLDISINKGGTSHFSSDLDGVWWLQGWALDA